MKKRVPRVGVGGRRIDTIYHKNIISIFNLAIVCLASPPREFQSNGTQDKSLAVPKMSENI